MPKGKRSKKKDNSIKDNISVVILIVISILLVILIYSNSGYLGKTLSPLLGGLIGWIKYILPIGTFLVAISIACKKTDNMSTKLIQYGVLLLCVTVIMSTYQISKGEFDMYKDFTESLKHAYDLGAKNIGGGIIGTAVAIPLTNLLEIAGTYTVSIGVAIISLIFICGIKPAEILANIIENIKSKKEIRKEEKLEEKKDKKLKKLEKYDKEEKLEDQITINLNDSIDEKNKTKEKEENTGYIEANLFKQVQEKKEDKVKEVLVLDHAMTVEDENYEFPPIEFLQEGKKVVKGSKKALTDTASKLQKTLYSFGVSAKVENVSVGPSITRYEIKPAEGVRVSKIANLADDIALNLAAETIRIEAPIPGKQAVGIEIPNKEKEVVPLRDIIDSDEFRKAKSKTSFALGKDVAGETIVTDIEKMPHVLIAGSTGSGKSVCINTLIASIIYKAKPSEVKLVMIDPKVVELSTYNGIPHLLIPVVTDPKKAAGALLWAVQEMVNRYSLFATKGVRDIKGYNELLETDEGIEKLPQIIIIIDELADLMMVAPNDVEDSICRLAQMARAAGMHLVVATQRPSVDVITGIIKANIPTRISFAVSSGVDSRTILDTYGAEKLLGKGDMLFAPVGTQKPLRIQGAFISDGEVEKIVDFLKSNGDVKYNEDIIDKIEKANSTDKELDNTSDDDTDSFLMDAIDTVVETRQASTSFIQRRFKVGYARAGRIMDQMEERGIISPPEGSKPRQVLITKEQLEELKMAKPTEEVQE